MDTAVNDIFPFIIESLSQTPLNEEIQNHLLEDVRRKMKNQGLRTANLKKNFEQTLEIGEEMGIFQLIPIDTNEQTPLVTRSMPLDSKKEKISPSDKMRRSRRRPRRGRRRSQRIRKMRRRARSRR